MWFDFRYLKLKDKLYQTQIKLFLTCLLILFLLVLSFLNFSDLTESAEKLKNTEKLWK